MSDDNEPVSGRCLCGAVTFSVTPKNLDVGVCHCEMCRRWTAGAFMAIECDPEVSFENTDSLGVYQSSKWGERGFCTSCGTPIFWRTRTKDHWVFSANALDLKDEPKLTSEIFIDSKPAYYSFANDTTKMTGAEVFAKYVGNQEK